MISKLLLLSVLGVAGFFWYLEHSPSSPSTPASSVSSQQERQQRSAALDRAFQERRGDVQVAGSGTVIKLLGDDNKGSRHQRFILSLASGRTLLVAHNIDLAPRIDSLQIGDDIEFYGEYEWNAKGGVLHWTHDDPHGKHAAGWLRHEGVLYQ